MQVIDIGIKFTISVHLYAELYELSHTHTHTRAHTLTLTHSHTRAHTRTLTLKLTHTLFFFLVILL